MWISAASLHYRVKWASAPERPISCNCPRQCGSAPGVPGDRPPPTGVAVRPNWLVPLIRCSTMAAPPRPPTPSPPPLTSPWPPHYIDVQLCSVFWAPVAFLFSLFSLFHRLGMCASCHVGKVITSCVSIVLYCNSKECLKSFKLLWAQYCTQDVFFSILV